MPSCGFQPQLQIRTCTRWGHHFCFLRRPQSRISRRQTSTVHEPGMITGKIGSLETIKCHCHCAGVLYIYVYIYIYDICIYIYICMRYMHEVYIYILMLYLYGIHIYNYIYVYTQFIYTCLLVESWLRLNMLYIICYVPLCHALIMGDPLR